MAFEFKLPDIGEGVVEGEVVEWKVSEGDQIALDQPMVDVTTDKATVEIPSPRAGTVSKILVDAGAVCAVGQGMILIEDGSQSEAPSAEDEKPKTGTNGHQAASAPVAATPQARNAGARVLATPATRKLARELGVELGQISGTGRNGRVTSDDVRAFQGGTASGGSTAMVQQSFSPVSIASGGLEERVPFRGVRKAIAANMVRSKFTATHFTYVEEIDVTELVALRASVKHRAEERGVSLTYLPFILKALISGLKKWPSLNSSLDEAAQEIVLKKYYHIGIATQGPQGLSVGVVRDADRRSIFDVANEIARLSDAIRDGKATREELTGSTFTITSLGKLGGLLATPIINFPEAAILGIHKIEQRPVVREGEIVARHMMNLSISVDHRIADGYDGAMLLQEIKQYLEDPTLMFMEMV